MTGAAQLDLRSVPAPCVENEDGPMKTKLAVLSLAAAAALPATAAATPPQREPVPNEVFTFPAGLYCDFPIEVAPVHLGEKLTFFSDGRVRVTGAAIVKLTNLDNRRSTIINSSGPGLLDRGTQQGAALFFVSPDEFGGPGIFLYHGNLQVTRDENGNISNITGTGTHSGNLCATVA
jgi:hypothetical protein